jgi:hypothetical protein
MARVSIREKASQQIAARKYSIAVVFEPVGSGRGPSGNGARKSRGNKQDVSGYQVTVPLLPGLITYGRTLAEVRDMRAMRFRATGKVWKKMASGFRTKRARFRKNFA